MNKDQIELFEQMQLVFAKKDDIEKLRQEANANFRKLKEENKELILGWIDGIRNWLVARRSALLEPRARARPARVSASPSEAGFHGVFHGVKVLETVQ